MHHNKGFVLVLVVLCFSGVEGAWAGEDDHVDVPVEFYFGRWVPGHSIQGYQRFTNHFEPDASSDYSYTSTRWRLGLSQLQDLILFSDDGTLFTTSSFSGHWRPRANLQIGIEELYYYSLETDEPYSRICYNRTEEELIKRSSECLSLQASLQWSNHSNVRLSDRLAKLMYLSSTLVGEGSLLLKGSSRERSVEMDEHWVGEFDSKTNVKRDTLKWIHKIEGIWGFRENLNLGFALALESFPTSWRANTSSEEPGAVLSISDSHEERYRTYSYSLHTLYAPTGDLFLDLRWMEAEESARNIDEEEQIACVSPCDPAASSLTETTKHGWQNTASITVDYLTTGDFVPQLLLDDYRGYYRHMLSGGQFHARSTIAGSRGTNSADFSFLSLDCYFETGAALSGRCQVEASASYRWHSVSNPIYITDTTSYGASITSSLSFRWRSFDYRAGVGPGWSRDVLLDASLGPLLPANEAYVSVELELPSYGADEFVGEGAFNARKFVYYSDPSLSVNGVYGVLRSVEVTLSGAASLMLSDHKFPTQHESAFGYVSYSLGTAYRVTKRLEVDLAFNDVFFPNREHAGDRAEIRGDFRALL